ncbi:phage portal protein [Lysinibacillus sp. NPDC096418]|uniref:phage portal protein n=1 Tax=Lysinibacillus sp. NPDC096418 TaxID=3364138 RepID=UPI0038035505
MSFLSKVFQRNKSLDSSYDFNFDGIEIEQRAYLKSMALEICIGFIARTVAQSVFRISEDGKRVYDDWDYLLNVRPNTDQSAADFWQRFAYRAIFDNEVLVIKTDSNDLLIADSFTRKEYAVLPDVFSDVTVKDYTFKRTFNMDEVIHITYNNEKLDKFMKGMFEDYTELFSRMIQTSMYSNQIRALAGMESSQDLSPEKLAKLQSFIDKMFNAFKTKAFAIVPKLKGFDYTELTNGANGGRSIEDITKISDKAVEHVAQLLGIPVALVRGDMSEYETALKAYDKFCYSPFLKKISDELNNKTIEKEDYQNGRKIQVRGITMESPLDLLAKADKGVASGIINPDEGREMIGLEPTGLPEMQAYYITKNYEKAEHSKGGEKGNESKTSV